jgi:hypothetical protein
VKRFLISALIAVYLCASVASAKVGGTITPELLQQYNYEVVYTMPCDWSGESTLFAYYGAPPNTVQYDIQADYQVIFGQHYNMRFNSLILERDGLPLHRIEIDYVPDRNKRCVNREFGFPGPLVK